MSENADSKSPLIPWIGEPDSLELVHAMREMLASHRSPTQTALKISSSPRLDAAMKMLPDLNAARSEGPEALRAKVLEYLLSAIGSGVIQQREAIHIGHVLFGQLTEDEYEKIKDI